MRNWTIFFNSFKILFLLGCIKTVSFIESSDQYICCQIIKAFDNIILEPLVTEISIIKCIQFTLYSVDTGYLSLSSEEANGIVGKTSRIIKKNISINSCQKKSNFYPGHQLQNIHTGSAWDQQILLKCEPTCTKLSPHQGGSNQESLCASHMDPVHAGEAWICANSMAEEQSEGSWLQGDALCQPNSGHTLPSASIAGLTFQVDSWLQETHHPI